VAFYGGDLTCNNFGDRDPGCGLVFELSNDGAGNWTENYLHVFGLFDGALPYGNLTFDSAGNLYGTTVDGPGVGCEDDAQYCGTVFTLANDGSWTLSTLYTFLGGSDGAAPNGNLVFDAHGNLYGTTAYGGGATKCYFYGCGTVFELLPLRGGLWQERILRKFGTGPGANALAFPQGGLTFDGVGNAYAVLGETNAYGDGGVVELTPAPTLPWTATALHQFIPRGDAYPNRYAPGSGLIADSEGNLYGAALGGGKWDAGVVFELTPHSDGVWTERILYTFTGSTDGGAPQASLVFDSAGNLYGTAELGGSSTCSYYGGCGVVFELSKSDNSWQETVLYTFAGTSDGGFPDSALIFDHEGNLYGTTTLGGSSSSPCQPIGGCGTVFELTPSRGRWQLQTLYAFQAGPDGANPQSLIFDQAGNLYGTTAWGADGFGGNGNGTVFELIPNAGGWSEKIIHAFQGDADGSYPFGLAIDHDGNLYGTTQYGGTDGGACNHYTCGTVFELSPSAGRWNKTVLYAFQPQHSRGDGERPESGVVFDAAGNLYGTASRSLDNYFGAVFELSPDSGGKWSEKVLEEFSDQGGFNPVGPVMVDSSGNVFGIASQGGTTGWGAVYEVPASATNGTQPHSSPSPKPRSAHSAPREPRRPAIPAHVPPRRPDPPLERTTANPPAGGKVQ
jgi:hypothetical protein